MAVALGAVGALASGVMGFAQSSYQASIAKMNQQIAKRNAVMTADRTQIEQENQDVKAANALGEQVSSQAASGLSLTSPSMVRSRQTARRLARMDALNIRQAGRIDEYNYMSAAATFKAQAAADRASRFGDLLGGFMGAAKSLIGSGSMSAFSFGGGDTGASRSGMLFHHDEPSDPALIYGA